MLLVVVLVSGADADGFLLPPPIGDMGCRHPGIEDR